MPWVLGFNGFDTDGLRSEGFDFIGFDGDGLEARLAFTTSGQRNHARGAKELQKDHRF